MQMLQLTVWTDVNSSVSVLRLSKTTKPNNNIKYKMLRDAAEFSIFVVSLFPLFILLLVIVLIYYCDQAKLFFFPFSHIFQMFSLTHNLKC